MDILKRLNTAGIVPVVVIDDAKNAVPTAKALLAGGINVMEITFRTAAAPDAIKAVGAGTVITLEQCKKAMEMGAKFIVSPGFDAEVVKWCVDNGVAITPGCVTPSEIMAAMKLGLKVVKFFPANVYGGLNAMKALSAPFIHAVGGSWICPKTDIAAGNFEKITALCAESRRNLLGYEVAHVGINTKDNDAAQDVANTFGAAFGFAAKGGNSSVFASTSIEVMKSQYLGKQGHLAVRANQIDIAVADLKKKGFQVDMETAKYKGDRMIAVYLKNEIGGFAIHLLQK